MINNSSGLPPRHATIEVEKRGGGAKQMIRIQGQRFDTVEDARAGLATAIQLEFSTIAVYL